MKTEATDDPTFGCEESLESAVSDDLTLLIVKLTDSFESLWDELAEELGVDARYFDSTERIETERSGNALIIIAAGGEEADGLDALAVLPQATRASTYLVGATTEHRFGIEAMRRGAADYFALPADADLLRRTLAARINAARAQRAASQRPTTDHFEAIVGESPPLHEVLARARRVAEHGDVTVLIGGETGTGKELLARAVHDAGPRASGPFVEINCAAIPSNLLESELFGHERGAFTDAHRDRVGLFEEANGGTLFLDEIGHLPVDLQGKLLRALEQKRIRRVGGTENRDIDVRIVAATNVDLRDAISRGEFREDLFYRLNVVSLDLPPLRERGSDIELLARRFVVGLAGRYGLPVPDVSPELVDKLTRHAWPGNVRELRHALERAMLLSPSGTLESNELALETNATTKSSDCVLPFPATLREIDIAAAAATVRVSGNNKSAAARRLGVSRARLQRLLDGHPDEGHDV